MYYNIINLAHSFSLFLLIIMIAPHLLHETVGIEKGARSRAVQVSASEYTNLLYAG